MCALSAAESFPIRSNICDCAATAGRAAGKRKFDLREIRFKNAHAEIEKSDAAYGAGNAGLLTPPKSA